MHFCSEVWVSVLICVCKSVCNAYCEFMCWCKGGGSGGWWWRSCVSVHTCISSLVFLPSSFQRGLKIKMYAAVRSKLSRYLSPQVYTLGTGRP